MSCEELSQELSAYIDGELSSAERVRLEKHLEGCTRCSEELQALKSVSALVGSLPAVTASPGFSALLEKKLARERRRPWLRPVPLHLGDLFPALAVAALALVAVTLTFVVPHFTSSPVTPGPTGMAPTAVPSESAPAAAGPGPASEFERAGGVAPKGGPARTAGGADEALRTPADGLPRVPPQPATPQSTRTTSLTEAKSGEANGYVARMRSPANAAKGGAAEEQLQRSDRLPAVEGKAESFGYVDKNGRTTEPLTAIAPIELKAVSARQTAVPEAPQPATTARQPFHTVTYYCSERAEGLKSFNLALDEFHSTMPPVREPATVQPMTATQTKAYANLIHNLINDDHVVAYKELVVPASDVELIQAVYAGRADLRPEHPPKDAAADAARTRVQADRSAGSQRGGLSDGLGLGSARTQARAAYERQVSQRPAQRLVRVVLVLRQQDTTKPTDQ